MLLGVKVAKLLPSHEVSFVNCYQEMGDMHHQDLGVSFRLDSLGGGFEH